MTDEQVKMVFLVGEKTIKGIAELSKNPELPNVVFGTKVVVGQGNSPEKFTVTIERGELT